MNLQPAFYPKLTKVDGKRAEWDELTRQLWQKVADRHFLIEAEKKRPPKVAEANYIKRESAGLHGFTYRIGRRRGYHQWTLGMAL